MATPLAALPQLSASQRETLGSLGLLILRLSVGGLMLTHGLPKLLNFGEMLTKFADPIGLGVPLSLILAVGAEVGCSLLLILGLATRLAAFPLMFTMAVAFFLVHGADPLGEKELPLLYLLSYLSLMLTGPGRFSLDHLIAQRLAKD
ncbi:MAG: DoxX family protein [Candidatus Sericytochromatia bacterium]